MRLALILALFTPLLIAAAATPPPGSSTRREILEALRPKIEAELGSNLEFVVTTLKVENGWAFVMAEPRRRGGQTIDGRALFPDMWDNMDGLTTTAVLQRKQGRWTVVDSAIGATDVWYCGTPELAQMEGVCRF
jgi:hypothetical protein